MDEKQLREILERFISHAKQDEDGGIAVFGEFADCIEGFFDDLGSEDYFGTEGQCHPFGDKRDED